MRVRDWMSPDPVVVSVDTEIREARRLLAYYGIRHLPVMEGDALVGIISDRDVLRIEEDRTASADPPDPQLGEPTVEAIMSTPAHVAGIDDDVETAARRMLAHRISALPVLDGDESLAGLITTTDCLLASLKRYDADAKERA